MKLTTKIIIAYLVVTLVSSIFLMKGLLYAEKEVASTYIPPIVKEIKNSKISVVLRTEEDGAVSLKSNFAPIKIYILKSNDTIPQKLNVRVPHNGIKVSDIINDTVFIDVEYDKSMLTGNGLIIQLDAHHNAEIKIIADKKFSKYFRPSVRGAYASGRLTLNKLEIDMPGCSSIFLDMMSLNRLYINNPIKTDFRSVKVKEFDFVAGDKFNMFNIPGTDNQQIDNFNVTGKYAAYVLAETKWLLSKSLH